MGRRQWQIGVPVIYKQDGVWCVRIKPNQFVEGRDYARAIAYVIKLNKGN